MLATAAAGAGAGVDDEGGSIIGLPSRRAFSRAVLSARAFLSISICALIAARAFASSILSAWKFEDEYNRHHGVKNKRYLSCVAPPLS